MHDSKCELKYNKYNLISPFGNSFNYFLPIFIKTFD